jgi:hypothetical protein
MTCEEADRLLNAYSSIPWSSNSSGIWDSARRANLSQSDFRNFAPCLQRAYRGESLRRIFSAEGR